MKEKSPKWREKTEEQSNDRHKKTRLVIGLFRVFQSWVGGSDWRKILYIQHPQYYGTRHQLSSLTSDCLSMAISLNEFYACICIIFALALYSVPPLLLNPALSGYERIKVLAEQTGGAVFSALAGGRYSTSNNVREPLWQAMYEQATATSSSINLEKRMINLLIIVLRAVAALANALIAVLELIRQFIDWWLRKRN